MSARDSSALVRKVSLDGLRVFEAAARRLSFTRAAEELHVTQGAVSQRIRALEDELGLPLFERSAAGLRLTAAGAALASGVRDALERIAATLAEIGGAGDAAPLVVSVLPSFASRWLMPRFPRFAAAHPDIPVQIVALLGLADFRTQNVDLAIRFGEGRYPGLSVTRLMGDSVGPVCSPALLASRGPIDGVHDLPRLPLLHDSVADGDPSGSDWRSWATAVGADHLPLARGQRFSQADLAIEAAVLGLGVVLARTSLCSDQLRAGTLTRLPLPVVPTRWSYYLVHPPERAARPGLAALCAWLLEEVAAFGAVETESTPA
ncbi:MAG: transcriptional regulator GcvA [Acidisphaera sp.]|nr:transcriptional regulator GcvA [Acidisphaera sp.]